MQDRNQVQEMMAMDPVTESALAFFSLVVSFYACDNARSQECVQVPPGIVSWWALDDLSGSVAEDRIGSNPGIPTTTTMAAEGIVNGSFYFDGTNFVVMPDSDLWAFGKHDFTIELWVNFNTVESGSLVHPSHIFIGNDQGQGVAPKWFFALGGGFLNFHFTGIIQQHWVALAPFSPDPGRWYHLAITRSGDVFTSYIDGTVAASEIQSDTILDPNSSLTIGQAENLGFMNGWIDEISIYDRALTGQELHDIYTASGLGKCEQLYIVPDRAWNTGLATITLHGIGFDEELEIRLSRENYVDIQASVIKPDEGLVQATFDLAGVIPGEWTLTTWNPKTNQIKNVPFAVEIGQTKRLSIQLVSPAIVRKGRNTTFAAVIRNESLADIDNVFVSMGIAGEQGAGGGLNTAIPVEQYIPKIPPMAAVPVLLRASLTTCAVLFAATEFIDYAKACQDLIRARDQVKRKIAELESQLVTVTIKYRELNCDSPDTVPHFEFCQELLKYMDELRDSISILGSLLASIEQDISLFCPGMGAGAGVFDAVRWETGRGAAEETGTQICPVTSWDPNEKFGPIGTGSEHYIAGGAIPLIYSILCENKAEAQAAAQEILITDRIDANLDWASFQIESLRIGERTITFPPATRRYQGTLDLRPSVKNIVVVDISMDIGTGTLNCLLSGKDPDTGDLADLLPANKPGIQPGGEAELSYSLKSNNNLPTGTLLRNTAMIDFEVNLPPDPLSTQETLHTIDRDFPTSRLASVTSTDGTGMLELRWNGEDLGSGIKHYNVYISRDGAAYELLYTETDATNSVYHGDCGSTYAFYTLATDMVGNVEKKEPEQIPDVELSVQCALQRPGDCNQDGVLDISDGICLLNFLFQGTVKVLPCGNGKATDAANVSLLDSNMDHSLDLSDAVTVFAFLFLESPLHAIPTACVPIVDCANTCI